MYLNNFPAKKLVFLVSDVIVTHGDVTVSNLAYGAGCGWRADSIGSIWNMGRIEAVDRFMAVNNAANIWKTSQVILEFVEYSQPIFDATVEVATQFIIDHHCSLLNGNNLGGLTAGDKVILDTLTNKLGARLWVKQIISPISRIRGTSAQITLNVSNTGIATLYDDYCIYLSLRNSGGTVVYTVKCSNIKGILPGEHTIVETITIPSNIATGTYSIGIAVKDQNSIIPDWNLANTITPSNGYYYLNTIDIN